MYTLVYNGQQIANHLVRNRQRPGNLKIRLFLMLDDKQETLLQNKLGNMRLLSLLLSTSFVAAGCTTVSPEQFRSYSANERAHLICNESKPARHRRYEINNTWRKIEKQLTLLDTGYRVHKHCQTVTEKKEGNCPNAPKSESICTPASETKSELCTETPIAIDPYYEESVLNNLKARLSKIESTHNNLFMICAERAKSLRFEEAYYLYEKGLEP